MMIMSRSLFYFLLIVFFLIFINSHGYDFLIPSSSARCPSHHCGDVTIKYPFWSIDDDTGAVQMYCGYPDFGLTCSNGEAILKLANDTYHVRDINYTSHTMTLVDIDAVDPKVGCPRARHNLSIDTLPLGYSSLDLNISFYFNCSSDITSAHAVECLSSGGLKSYVTVTTNGVETPDWFGVCQENVLVTVMKTHVAGNDLNARFASAMNSGFQLDWRVLQKCAECEASEGYCAHTNTTGEFFCVCNDSVRAHHCRGKGWNLRLKILIGVAASLGTALVLVVGFIIWYRRKKKRHAPTFVSKSITSDPSSKADIEIGGNYNGVHLFTYEELEAATNNFDSAKELGEGGFGTVYYGQLYDGRTVAVKRLYENNYKRVGQFMNEVDILTRLRHPHLVSLYGCTSRSSRELLLVYEYVPNGTVADHLHGERAKPGALPWTVRMNIAVETASALAYLHKSDIIHRDVKTNNILLDNNYWVKVADFGLSRLFPTDVTHVSTAPQGTPGYVDPEYHECYQLTSKSDVYSFGVVLIELISSMPAVDITRHRQEINLSNMAINKIQRDALNELVDPNLGFESDYAVRKMVIAVAELAFRCLQWAKDMRPPMDEVLEALKEIQNAEYSMEKGENLDILSDNVGLLKSVQLQLSPDTVTTNWTSTSTTPSASGKSVLDSGKEEILEITSDNVGLLRSTAPMQPSSGTVTTNTSTMPNASG